MLLGVGLTAFIAVSTFAGEMNTGRMYPPRGRSVSISSPVQASGRSVLASLKSSIKHCIRVVADAPVISPIVYSGPVKRVLLNLPGSRLLYSSEWDRKHPYDRAHGTDTSGFLCGPDILTGHPAEEHGSPYAGVQPSVLRTALKSLPSTEGATFIDLGCGKGRPMCIATEFPFRDIVGVELSPPLATVARRNAELMARRFRERPRVRVHEGDATTFPMPPGDVVLFIYNSFDAELMQKVADNVEAALEADSQRNFYVVYCNPASGHCFDHCSRLSRRFARTVPYVREEQGYSPDKDDAVIIWQGGTAPAPTEKADGKIVIVKERWRAALA